VSAARKAPTILFMHVGPDVQLPTIMARSFRRHNPDARIVQMTDLASPAIAGVDAVERRPAPHRNIMLYRMQLFAEAPTSGPTWFLDTDMICNRPLLFEGGGDPQVAVCVREFDRAGIFNHRGGGADFSEYAGRRLGDLYPYVGCATLLENSSFWAECLADYLTLDPKFFNWYGDQEAIRNVVQSGRFPVAALPESLYACLPEHQTPAMNPVISHYKGRRKALMLERAAREGLL
jgi:hypothetical protein